MIFFRLLRDLTPSNVRVGIFNPISHCLARKLQYRYSELLKDLILEDQETDLHQNLGPDEDQLLVELGLGTVTKTNRFPPLIIPSFPKEEPVVPPKPLPMTPIPVLPLPDIVYQPKEEDPVFQSDGFIVVPIPKPVTSSIDDPPVIVTTTLKPKIAPAKMKASSAPSSPRIEYRPRIDVESKSILTAPNPKPNYPVAAQTKPVTPPVPEPTPIASQPDIPPLTLFLPSPNLALGDDRPRHASAPARPSRGVPPEPDRSKFPLSPRTAVTSPQRPSRQLPPPTDKPPDTT